MIRYYFQDKLLQIKNQMAEVFTKLDFYPKASKPILLSNLKTKQ